MPARAILDTLTARVLAGVALPMIAVALALGVGGTLAIRATVDAVNDRILDAAARGIADSLTVEDGAVALDLPPTIFGMLENTARDNVYYGVRQDGRVLTGYPDLPPLAPAADADAPRFADGRYLGRDVRLVVRTRRLPGIARPLVVQVAETLDARAADVRRLLLALVALEAALIVLAVLLLPLSVRWGLRPVVRLRSELDRRAASDLTPLPLARVPGELRDLVTAFNALLARLGEAIGAMRRFTGDASHQMRTPLTILRTHVAALRTLPPGSAEARQSIEDIDAGSVRLARLIAQLLALARADNAIAGETAIERVDLAAIVAAVVGEQEDAAAAAGVTLTVGGAPREALTAPALAIELLSNLVDNAIRHGGPGTVRVLLEEGPAVAVEDEGPGIAAGDRGRAVERFTPIRTRGGAGSGLGLSIAHALAGAIGATLTLEDGSSGRGLRAVVRFTTPPAKAW
ncbi:two-component system sensor histidine kinase TctE [Sphingomonas jinjuensis]|uniref:histidine kinase n=1 Tax=Sphingomonas jinjuensis TaxID=535907 RepID=A0A840F9Q0_9SPHN|nr:sensor histidine kinase [Sphingomonas jinjuensis]MBB4154399.1 two-component system sensor histidine kinase TctE [Sphingomonas jinjuensis]